MNKIITSAVLTLILFICMLTACNQRDKHGTQQFNEKAIALNDSAVKIRMNFVSLNISEDSALKAIDLWKQSIEIDPQYKIAYLNLLNFNNSMGLFNNNISLCSNWLRHNPNDAGMLLKRGLIYEHLGKIDLSNKDYQSVEQMLSKEHTPEIDKNMTEKEIENIITIAYHKFIIKKNEEEPLEVLSKLYAYFPNNSRVKSGYEVLKNVSRTEYINSLLGEHNIVESLNSY